MGKGRAISGKGGFKFFWNEILNDDIRKDEPRSFLFSYLFIDSFEETKAIDNPKMLSACVSAFSLMISRKLDLTLPPSPILTLFYTH